MKKILAVLLTAVMLLGMLPMAAAAETANPQFKGYTLFLKESIAISFYAEEAALEGFDKVVFYKNDQKVEEITTQPKADSDGLVHFKCTKLGPQEMGAAIKAELYVNGAVVDTRIKSVLDYCTTKLADTTSSAQLKALIVDMLNYGAAAQTYVAKENGTDAGTLVNAGLTTEQMNLGAISDPQLTILSGLDTTLANPEVTWKEAALTLTDGIVMDFAFSADSLEGLTMEVTSGDKTWTVDEFGTKVIADVTYHTFQFDGLNPAQMRDVVYVVAKRDGVEVSDKKAYSVEHYVATQVSKYVNSAIAAGQKTPETPLVQLVQAMIQYGDAAAMYANAHTYDADGRCTVCNVAHYQYNGGNIWIEAEDMDVLTTSGMDTFAATDLPTNTNFVNTTTKAPKPSAELNAQTAYDWSGSKAVILRTPSTATGSDYGVRIPQISCEVTPENDGTYYIWIKVYSNQGTLYRYFVDADNAPNGLKYKGQNPNATSTHVWMKLDSSFVWTKGQNYTIRFRSCNTGMGFVDRIVITDEAEFNPTNHTTHTYSNEYKYDENYHWQEATCCQGVTTEKQEHTVVNMACTVCQKSFMWNTTLQAEDADLADKNDENVVNDKTKDFVLIVDETNASGGKAVKMNYNITNWAGLLNLGKTPVPHVSFTVTPEQTGEYYVWAKVYATDSNNIFCYIDGASIYSGTTLQNVADYYWRCPLTKEDASETDGDFIWVRLTNEYRVDATLKYTRRYNWTAGETYTINFRSGSSGVLLDEIYVTNDPNYVPGAAVE